MAQHITRRMCCLSKISTILLKSFPIIPCNLCGSQENLQRQVVKDMLQGWEKQHPGRLDTMFSAVQNVVPSHLADTELFDFKGLAQSDDALKRLNIISL